jgi:hypothetical protein
MNCLHERTWCISGWPFHDAVSIETVASKRRMVWETAVLVQPWFYLDAHVGVMSRTFPSTSLPTRNAFLSVRPRMYRLRSLVAGSLKVSHIATISPNVIGRGD